MSNKKIRILLTGGGTGGHVFPIIAVVQGIKCQIQKRGYVDELEFLFVGAVDKESKKMLENAGIKVKKVFTFKLRRYFSFKTILEIFTFPLGFLQCFWHLFWYMPDVIFGKGGYGSFSAILVGYLYFIPILIHESDVYPGLANRITSKLATRVAISFSDTLQYFPSKKTALAGNPVREDILGGNIEEARIRYNLKKDLPSIFVIGGSQGSQIINSTLYKVLPSLLKEAYVFHQCGSFNIENCKKKLEELKLDQELESRYYLFDFIGSELKDLYALADLVITRAGANTLSELSLYGKASIIIPLHNSAGQHQEKNAFFFAEKNAAIFIEEENLQGRLFLNIILDLLKDKEKMNTLSENIKKIFVFDANKIIADGIIDLVKSK